MSDPVELRWVGPCSIETSARRNATVDVKLLVLNAELRDDSLRAYGPG